MLIKKIILNVFVLLIPAAFCFGQSAIQIKKKTSYKIPGIPMNMPGMEQLENRPSVVSIKGSRMRVDSEYKKRTMTGGKEKVIQTRITQCDRQRMVSFNNKKKKYFVEPIAGQTSDNVKNARKGGVVTMVGSVTDTGERAKLFGYDARRLKQSFTVTPGKDACQKETLKVEIDGWYIDVPEFSCPIKRKPREFQMDSKCFDDVDFQMKGAVSGIPVKEIQTMTFQGMTLTIEEEATELTKTTFDDALFEPPANYSAANTFKEVEDDSDDPSDLAENSEPIPAPTSSVNTAPTLALPRAGVERSPTEAKKAGVIRIGIVKPLVQLAEKDSADQASELTSAIAEYFGELLKTQTVETVELTTDAEGKKLECDYLLFASVSQKKGGGGLFGKIMPTMPSISGSTPNKNSPNPQSSPAAARLMSLMMSIAKPKDEFTFSYKLIDALGTIQSQAETKTKAKQYGEDVVSPQIKDAVAAITGKVAK